MNKNTHRIVFNECRGCLMAVAETATPQGKSASGERTDSASAQGLHRSMGAIALACKLVGQTVLISVAALWLAPMQAQTAGASVATRIVADPTAVRSQQATILNTSNGVLQVNIQTPSAAGVSRNTYSQFDVGNQGAILNNSRTNVQTRLGGWVQGNPWLATGSARIILNEVNSSNPSHLQGYVEVAGQRAEVIIANPSGIAVNGGGFINASGVTLTVGIPVLNNGNLESYRVQRGSVSVDGAGLDTRTADYTAVLSRAAQINAGIWANRLHVVTGANQIDASTLGTDAPVQTQALPGAGSTPAYALDVGQIGGMYAGKITLIGTEAGLGVRNAGMVQAASGPLTLTQEGWLSNSGTLQAAGGDVQIQTRGAIEQSGTVYSDKNVLLASRSNQTHSGTTAALGNVSIHAVGSNSDSSAAQIQAGHTTVWAAGLQTDGQLTGQQNLSVQATGQVQTAGQALATSTLSLQGDSLDLSQSRQQAPALKLQASAGDFKATDSQLLASDLLLVQTPQALITDGAKVQAGTLSLNAHSLSNVAGQIVQTGTTDQTIALQGGMNNRAGIIQSGANTLSISAQSIDNTAGQLLHTGTGSLQLTSQGQLFNNTQSSAQAAVADGARIVSTGALNISSGQMDSSGSVYAAKDLSIQASSLNNSGAMYAAGQQTLTVTNAIISSGTIAAAKDLTATAASLAGTSAHVLAAGMAQDGKLTGTGALSVAATGALQSAGQALATGNVGLTGASVDLSGSTSTTSVVGSTTGDVSLSASSGDILTRNAQVSAPGLLGITANGAATQTLDNTAGQLSGRQFSIRVGQLNNTRGTIHQTGTGAQTANIQSTGAVTNVGGAIFANAQDFTLQSGDKLDNTDGQIGHAGSATFMLNASQTDNTRGVVVSNNNMALRIASGLSNIQGALVAGQNLDITATGTASLDNTQGVVQANTGYLTLKLAALTNTSGKMYAGADLQAQIDGALTNTGFVAAQNNLTIQSRSLNSSTAGVLAAGVHPSGGFGSTGNLTITTQDALVANGKNLAAGQMNLTGASVDLSSSQSGAHDVTITANAGNISTRSADIVSQNSLSLYASQSNAHDLDNTSGTLLANTLTVNVSGTLSNKNAKLYANSQAQIQAGTVLNTNGKIHSAGNLTLLATNLDNSSGNMYAAQDGTLNVTTLNNRSGVLGSARDLQIQATQLASGSDSNGYGTIRAGRDLSLQTTGDQTITTPALAANRNLSFSTTGNLTNNSTIAAQGDLTLTAANVSNAAQMQANGTLSITATHSNGSIINAADIVGGSLVLKAPGSITNAGANALMGASDAAGKLVLLANNITNADDVTTTDTMPTTSIYAAGQVVLAGGIDSAGQYTRANSIVNRSALIESGADMLLAAQTITNTRRTLSMGTAFDQPISATDLAALNISLSGQTGKINTPDPNSIGGVYIDPPHGGSMNSDYLYTTYTGTANQNSVQSISPTARIMAGVNLGVQAGTLQNYWSQVASTGDMNVTGVTVDQDSWRGATTPQIKVAYSGNYVYRTYKGGIWSHSFCDVGCAAPGDNRYYKRTLYESSLTSNGTISGSGVTLNNGTSVVPIDGTRGSTTPLSDTGQLALSVVTASSVGGSNTTTAPKSTNLAANTITRTAALPAYTPLPGTLSVPGNGLFKPSPNPNASYLIETDPQFTQYKTWLGSDYMLSALNLDPSATQKRLGDGFYEQKLIREQVAQLTGRQLLGDYSSTDAEYRALMNNAVTVAKQFNLRPGVALTPDQVTQLTSDMVWLVSQEVTLPDGSRQSVLVPQVYLSQLTRQNLQRDGALVAANNIDLQDLQGMRNGGTVQARQNLALQTEGDLDTTGGSLGAGRQMTLLAGGNINLASASVQAGSLALSAGQDLNLQTLTQTTTSANGSRTTLGRQTSVQVAGDAVIATGGDFNVQGAKLGVGGSLAAQVGGNWNIGAVQANETKTANRFGGSASSNFTQNTGSSLTVGGDTLARVVGDLNVAGSQLQLGSQSSNTAQLGVGGSVNLSAVKDSGQINSSWNTSGGSFGSSSRGNYARLDETVQGSSLKAGGQLALQAGQNLNLSGSQMEAAGLLNLRAGGSVNVQATQEQHNSSLQDAGGRSGLVSSTQKLQQQSAASTLQVGSSIGGQSVNISAGKDLNVQGSAIVADQNVNLNAGGNVSIIAAQNTSSQSSFSQTTKSGLMSGGGLSISVGNRDQSLDQKSQQTTAAASTVGSTGGSVSITAGQTYTQTGSDVLTPAGNIDIAAKSVTINEARETGSQSSEQKFRQSGITLAVTSPVLSALQMADSQIKAAGNTQSSRMQALAAANAAFNLKQGADAVAAGQAKEGGNAADQAGGIGISLSVGGSSSTSQQQSSADSAKGSNLNAGGNIRIAATGDGANSDITVKGSDIKAAGNTTLKADDQINLLAAQNTSSESSTSKNSSGSIGVGINLGSDGFKAGVTVSAAAGKGQGAGNGSTFANSHIEGQSVTIDSGGDTTLKGATVTGNQVTASVGGNLNIESLQDSNQYKEKSQQVGGSVTFGPSPGGSLNVGQTKINSDYKSVGEQSAIRAGDGGFNVSVNGKTDLKGGQITSTQAGIDNKKNSYEARQGTETKDLSNTASYSAQSVSVGLGAGTPKPGASLSAGMSGVGIGSDKGSASSTTTAGISAITGNTSVRTGDVSTSLRPIFNKDQVKQEVAAQVAITSEFGKQASKFGGSEADKQRDAIKAQANAETDPDKKAALQAESAKWEEGGVYRVAMHTVIGGLTGGTAGAIGAGAASAAAPAIDQLQSQLQDGLQKAGLGDSASKVIAGLASGATAAGIGAAASGGNVAGAATAFNADMNNRQIGAQERNLARNLSDKAKASGLTKADGTAYTQADIENAMRNSGKGNDPVTTGIQVDPNNPNAITDKGASFTSNDGKTLVQINKDGSNLNPGNIDPKLAAYIVQETGGANTPYKDLLNQLESAKKGPPSNPNAGLNTITPATNGCVTSECAANVSPTRNPIKESDDVRQDASNAAALVGRGAGIVSNAATAAAAVPGPHQPGAAAVAATATGVDFVSKVVEQGMSPSAGKALFEILSTVAGDVANSKAPLAAPATNEAVEIWKNSNSTKSFTDWIDQQWSILKEVKK